MMLVVNKIRTHTAYVKQIRRSSSYHHLQRICKIWSTSSPIMNYSYFMYMIQCTNFQYPYYNRCRHKRDTYSLTPSFGRYVSPTFPTCDICTKWSVVVPIHLNHFFHHSSLKFCLFSKNWHPIVSNVIRLLLRCVFVCIRDQTIVFSKTNWHVLMIVCCQHCTVLLYSALRYCTLARPYHSHVTAVDAALFCTVVLSYGVRLCHMQVTKQAYDEIVRRRCTTVKQLHWTHPLLLFAG